MRTSLFILTALLFLGRETQAQSSTQAVIRSGDVWQYLVTDRDPATSWKTPLAPAYNDTSTPWFAGKSPLGYGGQGAGGTTIAAEGGTCLDRCISSPAVASSCRTCPSGTAQATTTYFRKTVTLTSVSGSTFALQYQRDDGIVIYVNGTEVTRENLPASPVTYSTLATAYPSDPDEVAWVMLDPSRFASLLREGTNLIAVEIHQYSATSSDVRFNLELKQTLAPQPPTSISIVSGDEWKYTIPATNPAASWKTDLSPSYNDPNTPWFGGRSPLGYGGQGSPATTIAAENGTCLDQCASTVASSCQTSCSSRAITTYFRKTVSLTNVSGSAFTMRYQRDDGIVIYVNGQEVTRNNMPGVTGDPVSFTTLATAYPSDPDEVAWVTLDPTKFASKLKDGQNLIAVEIHQYSATSSDLRFNLELRQTVTPTSEITIQRGPYLQMGTASGMTFRWSTNVASYGRVVCKSPAGVVKTSTWQPTTPLLLNATTTIHSDSVSIEGLDPDTKYTYSIEASLSASGSSPVLIQGGVDNFFRTAPVTGTASKPIRIWALGDFGRASASNRQEKVRDAFNNYLTTNNIDYVNLWLWLGDNAYDWGTADQYQQNVFDKYDSRLDPKQRIMKQTPVYATPGNHDYKNVSATDPTKSQDPNDPLTRQTHKIHYFDVINNYTKGDNSGVHSGKEEYYSYDYGNIHFISLDTYGFECEKQPDGTFTCPNGYGILNTDLRSDGEPKSAQVRWLKSDLVRAQQDARIKWIIVITHYPFYSMGTKDSDTDADIKPLREKFLKFLEQYKVDMVMTGHSHTYERSKPIRGHFGTENEFSTDSTRFMAPETPDAHARGWYVRPSAAGPKSTIFLKKSTDPNNYIVHVVNGSGGAMGGKQPSWPHAVMQQSYDEGGSMYLEITGNRLDAKFIAEDNQVKDQFTIFKDADPLIRAGSNWKYYVSNSAPASANWKGGGTFDDSGWPQGQAPLGYGNDGEVTRVPACPNDPTCATKSWTTYFRKPFTFNASAYAGTVAVADQRSLLINYRRDDGLVIYLNGQELWRENMPTGPITHTTPALGPAEPEKAWLTAIVSLTGLREGTNYLAAEVHQNSQTSSDLHFNLELIVSPYAYDPTTTSASRVAAGTVSPASEQADYTVKVYPNPTPDGKVFIAPALPYESYILTDDPG